MATKMTSSGCSVAARCLLLVAIFAVSPFAALGDNSDEFYYNSLFRDGSEGYGDKGTRNLDGIGGGHLIRDLNRAAFYARQQRSNFDPLSGATFGQNKRDGPLYGDKHYNAYPSWYGYPGEKRNFDEMDRSGFSSFVKKNFDEMDRSGFSSFNKKRNFDEMDRAGFDGFVKRDLTAFQQKQPSSSAAGASPVEHHN